MKAFGGKCEFGTKLPSDGGDCPVCGADPGTRCPKAVVREQEELTSLRAAIKKISEQMTSAELLEEHGEEFVGDFEEAYDAIIKVAREVSVSVSVSA